MKKGLVCLLVILSFSLASVAPCYFSDSPDCACFTNTATWNPAGTWIQDIALDTVGTIVSCVTDGGKPFYQMRLGLNSTSSATSFASIDSASLRLASFMRSRFGSTPMSSAKNCCPL